MSSNIVFTFILTLTGTQNRVKIFNSVLGVGKERTWSFTYFKKARIYNLYCDSAKCTRSKYLAFNTCFFYTNLIKELYVTLLYFIIIRVEASVSNYYSKIIIGLFTALIAYKNTNKSYIQTTKVLPCKSTNAMFQETDKTAVQNNWTVLSGVTLYLVILLEVVHKSLYCVQES